MTEAIAQRDPDPDQKTSGNYRRRRFLLAVLTAAAEFEDDDSYARAYDEFTAWTKSVWDFPTVSAKKVGHPAPFPLELPSRLIKLYSYKDDLVLDPFNGSGTICLAAEQLGRRWIGVDKDPGYCELAERILRKR